MSNRDLAIGVINNLSEEKLQAFLTLFADENTLARIETEAIASDNSRKHYNSFNEITEELKENWELAAQQQELFSIEPLK